MWLNLFLSGVDIHLMFSLGVEWNMQGNIWSQVFRVILTPYFQDFSVLSFFNFMVWRNSCILFNFSPPVKQVLREFIFEKGKEETAKWSRQNTDVLLCILGCQLPGGTSQRRVWMTILEGRTRRRLEAGVWHLHCKRGAEGQSVEGMEDGCGEQQLKLRRFLNSCKNLL